MKLSRLAIVPLTAALILVWAHSASAWTTQIDVGGNCSSYHATVANIENSPATVTSSSIPAWQGQTIPAGGTLSSGDLPYGAKGATVKVTLTWPDTGETSTKTKTVYPPKNCPCYGTTTTTYVTTTTQPTTTTTEAATTTTQATTTTTEAATTTLPGETTTTQPSGGSTTTTEATTTTQASGATTTTDGPTTSVLAAEVGADELASTGASIGILAAVAAAAIGIGFLCRFASRKGLGRD